MAESWIFIIMTYMYTKYTAKRIIKTNNVVYKFEEVEIFSNSHTKTIMKRDYDIVLFLVDCDRRWVMTSCDNGLYYEQNNHLKQYGNAKYKSTRRKRQLRLNSFWKPYCRFAARFDDYGNRFIQPPFFGFLF